MDPFAALSNTNNYGAINSMGGMGIGGQNQMGSNN